LEIKFQPEKLRIIKYEHDKLNGDNKITTRMINTAERTNEACDFIDFHRMESFFRQFMQNRTIKINT
jgi:hypothetical protein